VELDPALAAQLRVRFPCVVEGDARRVPLPREPYRVVANLPFAGGTEILRRILEDERLVAADVILQWETACRRAAVWPSTAQSAIWGATFDLSLVRRLPREAFAPPPEVDAGVLRASRRTKPLVPVAEAGRYGEFVHAGFRNGVRTVAPPLTLKRLGRDLGFPRHPRACDLDASQWAALYRIVRQAR
jgi:23S rRNA (adenine-N6)-dimethyltransferase